MNWNDPAIRKLVRLALAEDRASHDITTRTMIPPRLEIRAIIKAKQLGVVAGLPLAAIFFKAHDPHTRFSPAVEEGQQVKRGSILAEIRGKARSILAAERPALNALQHLSGIATFTFRQAARLQGTKTRLFDTRKTLPGWRALQKYAVRCGGGVNHRLSLADAILIKDNHLAICRKTDANWLSRAQRMIQRRASPVQMEIQTEHDLQDALSLKPGRVLLDNLPAFRLRPMIRRLRRAIPNLEIEISGGVKPEELRKLAVHGVERISMGRLTHSAPAFDCSLEITDVHPQ